MQNWLERSKKLFKERFNFDFELIENSSDVEHNLSKMLFTYEENTQTALFNLLELPNQKPIIAKVMGLKNYNQKLITNMSDWLQLVVKSQLENFNKAEVLNQVEEQMAKSQSSNVISFVTKKTIRETPNPVSLFSLNPKEPISSDIPIILHGTDKTNLFFLAQEIHDLSGNMGFLNLEYLIHDFYRFQSQTSQFNNNTIYIPELTELNMQQIDQLNELITRKNRPLIIASTTFTPSELNKKFSLSKGFLKNFIFCHFLSSKIDFSISFRERLRKSAQLALNQGTKINESMFTLKCAYTQKYFFLPFSSKLIEKLEQTNN